MKLVNIHTLFSLLLFILIGLNSTQAQVWSLEQCIDTAQVHNKNLQMSRNNISIGDQKEKEAKAYLLPKVTANADYKYFTNLPYQLMPLSTFNPTAPEGQFKEAQFGVPHNINANLQLSMPLYNPQVYGTIQTTKIASELTELQYKKTEEQIFFEISNLYYNAQIVYNQLAFIESNLLNAERLLKNFQLLKEQFLAKGTDIGIVKLQVGQLTSQKVSIGSKYEQVLNALKFAIGVSIKQNLQIEPNIQYQNANEYSPLSILDIHIIKTQNRLLSSELSTLNNSRFLPSLNLIGMYGTTGFGYDKQPTDFIKFFPIGFAGIQLSYPLFNGTVSQRKINQKKIEIQNNEIRFGLLTEQNNMQVQNAKMQKGVAKKTIETATEQIQLAQTIYEQTIIQQKQGTASLTDVLLAENALREAQQNYLSAVIDYLKADLNLKKLTGNISTTK
ncbi:TolC family protein [Cytophagaceae bacterium 50C-KIRBA]|uniref:TolC family protein n=1 Tax=Aquirufa beregesia TaxID=2516556 RepID=A0ABX0EY17_9BACT|nr:MULTISPECIES: TolC family protein [Aquirufa]MDF0692677.1 TolC family protein [Aquirufa ecclesiirivi]NGZ45504.1 TolC family protein [Aquirufa beregesia]NHC47956.1 TolC family protein [Aquirufa ecclesiirivi]